MASGAQRVPRLPRLEAEPNGSKVRRRPPKRGIAARRPSIRRRRAWRSRQACRRALESLDRYAPRRERRIGRAMRPHRGEEARQSNEAERGETDRRKERQRRQALGASGSGDVERHSTAQTSRGATVATTFRAPALSRHSTPDWSAIRGSRVARWAFRLFRARHGLAASTAATRKPASNALNGGVEACVERNADMPPTLHEYHAAAAPDRLLPPRARVPRARTSEDAGPEHRSARTDQRSSGESRSRNRAERDTSRTLRVDERIPCKAAR